MIDAGGETAIAPSSLPVSNPDRNLGPPVGFGDRLSCHLVAAVRSRRLFADSLGLELGISGTMPPGHHLSASRVEVRAFRVHDRLGAGRDYLQRLWGAARAEARSHRPALDAAAEPPGIV